MSQFLGVDPLADKYPMMNPLAYVFNNPLRYVDPTGMEGEDPPTYKVKEGNNVRVWTFGEISTKDGISGPDFMMVKSRQNIHLIWP